MRFFLLLSAFLAFSSPAFAGWEAFLSGVLKAKTKQMEEKRIERDLKKSAGINEKEIKLLESSMEGFTGCTDRVETDPKYLILSIKSPSKLTYNDFINTDFASAQEINNISWYANRVESCYLTSGFENQNPKSYAAYEMYKVTSNFYIKQMILLAKLNNKAISWGQFNYEMNESVIDIKSKMDDIKKNVKEKLNMSVNAMILENQKKMIIRQSNAISRMVNDRNYFENKLKNLEIEMEMSRVN